MWVYIRSDPGLWTVGHYAPSGEWIAESDHGSTDEAAARVRFLNGGAVIDGREADLAWKLSAAEQREKKHLYELAMLHDELARLKKGA